MSVLNRLVALLLLLVIFGAAVVAFLLIAAYLSVAQVRAAWPYAPVVAIVTDVTRLEVTTRMWVLIGSGIVALLCLALIMREFAPPPRRSRLLVLHGDNPPSYTEISYGALDEMATFRAREVSGVERARARVERRGGALSVSCAAMFAPYADAAATKAALEQALSERLERITGLPVGAVKIDARLSTPADRAPAHRQLR